MTLLHTLPEGGRFRVRGCPHLSGTVLRQGAGSVLVQYDRAGQRTINFRDEEGEHSVTFTRPEKMTISPNTEVEDGPEAA